jgi:hypothetical protein
MLIWQRKSCCDLRQVGVGQCSFLQPRNEAAIKFGVRLDLDQQVLSQFPSFTTSVVYVSI